MEQGHDLEMATNCLGPFILNQLLEPLMVRTAQQGGNSRLDGVRIVWVSSMLTALVPAGGIQFDEKSGSPRVLKNAMNNYMQTKVGNLFLASEEAKRVGKDGVISLVCLLARAVGRSKPELQLLCSFHRACWVLAFFSSMIISLLSSATAGRQNSGMLTLHDRV